MSTVEVTFTPLPAHVRTARLVATAVARRSGVDESLLDEVRLAVGEACSRAVEAHRKHCPRMPIRVALTDDSERFEVVVTDAAPAEEAQSPVTPGPSAPEAALPGSGGVIHQLPPGVGLAVISGLADDVRISAAGDGTSAGTSVAMSWKRRADVAGG